MRLTFGIDAALWTTAAKEKNGVPWYAGVVKGAARFMTAWHKEEEASRKRAGKRTERELSTTSKEKTEKEEEEKREGEARGSKRRKTRKDETTAAEVSFCLFCHSSVTFFLCLTFYFFLFHFVTWLWTRLPFLVFLYLVLFLYSVV
ncbi:unnamed protein product [Pylaiella littoralis]